MARTGWIVDKSKYLSPKEVKQFLKTAKFLAETALLYGHKTPVRDYFIVHLAVATGLRVSEIAYLNCGDIYENPKGGYLIVRKGKGSKQRLVRFSSTFSQHLNEYLDWKQAHNEPAVPGDPLLRSSHTGGHMTSRALEKAFKRVAAKANIPRRYSIHSLRHTHACLLLEASKGNIRLVQKQLGHSKITTTQVYADVMDIEMQRSMERLSV
jgi:site-specific recombinase XerD